MMDCLPRKLLKKTISYKEVFETIIRSIKISKTAM